MKTPPISIKVVTESGTTPTPIARAAKHATMDAGILIMGSLIGLAIAGGYYIYRNSLKANEQKAQDAAALIQKTTPDAAIDRPRSCEEILGRLATNKELAACKKGLEEGANNAARALIH